MKRRSMTFCFCFVMTILAVGCQRPGFQKASDTSVTVEDAQRECAERRLDELCALAAAIDHGNPTVSSLEHDADDASRSEPSELGKQLQDLNEFLAQRIEYLHKKLGESTYDSPL